MALLAFGKQCGIGEGTPAAENDPIICNASVMMILLEIVRLHVILPPTYISHNKVFGTFQDVKIDGYGAPIDKSEAL